MQDLKGRLETHVVIDNGLKKLRDGFGGSGVGQSIPDPVSSYVRTRSDGKLMRRS